MLYLNCTTISSVDLAEYGLSLAKDWVSQECGTNIIISYLIFVYTIIIHSEDSKWADQIVWLITYIFKENSRIAVTKFSQLPTRWLHILLG